jgi:hypothetical protein
MVKERQQTKLADVNLKSLATGRKRVWDARVRPEDVAAMRSREWQKAPWLLYVTVLESGDVLSKETPDREFIRLVEQTPAVGFIGALQVDPEHIQFFTRALKVGAAHERLLDAVVNTLRKQAEDALRNKGQSSFRVEVK